ncbi:MAG: hypothetical protein LBQ60_18910 [Bacteroidales bacterium]|jgi:outer membrane protein OmpA-like peptidoglycan-associated protein|nr:hypothetical protein [Bacteroidales bacterium]
MKKKIIFHLSLLLIILPNLVAQDNDPVRFSKIQLEKKGNRVFLTLDISVERNQPREYRLITPGIEGGSSSMAFKPIVIESRHAQMIGLRNAKRMKTKQADTYQKGNSFTYTDTILYKDWMDGGKFYLNVTDSFCCKIKKSYTIVKIDPVTFKNNLVPVVKEVKISAEKNITIENSITNDEQVVYFAQGKASLDTQLSDDPSYLNELYDTLRSIISTSGNKLISIEITSYASPEGNYQDNMQLSCDRARSLKDFLLEKVPVLNDSLFLLNCKGENWEGLQDLVHQSDMPYRDEVLEIIANTTMDDGGVSRKNELRKLKNGTIYKYMLEHFYPKLRNARDITIKYFSTGNENIQDSPEK